MTCSGAGCLASASARRFCAAVPTATSSTSRRSSICSSICAPATRHRSTSTWRAANSPAISASSSCSMRPGPPPMPIRTASPSTTTSGGRPPHWPPRSKSSATASRSMHSGPTADTPSICRRSRRSSNVSAPSAGHGSTNSNRRATRASAPASVVQARFSRPRPAPRIGCCSSCRTASPTTTATKAATRKPTPKALEELRTDGVACLCLSIGAATATEALERVFGSASIASAATLADLSPQMDELFLSSLQELAAPVQLRG